MIGRKLIELFPFCVTQVFVEEASQLVIHLKDDSKKGHHDLLIAQILLREAEAKITGKVEPKPPGGDAKPSPKKPGKSPPPDEPGGDSR